MGDSILLNDGTSFLVLNDGTSQILLNAHEDGVKTQNIHAAQQTVRKRKTQLIPVEFKFKLTSRLIPKIHAHLVDFGEMLRDKGMYSNSIRKYFKQPTEYKKTIRKLLRTDLFNDLREKLITEDFVLTYYLLKLINKREKDGNTK